MFFQTFLQNHGSQHHAHGELTPMYISTLFRELGANMIGLLLPVFLLREFGFSVANIFWFYTVIGAVQLVLIPLAGQLTARRGPYWAMFWSTPLLAAALAGFSFADQIPGLIWLLAVLWGVFNTFFWFGYHLAFGYAARKSGSGSSMGIVILIRLIVQAAAPIAGGVLADAFGAESTVLVVTGLILVSMVPLFFGSRQHSHPRFDAKKSLQKLLAPKHRWEFGAWIAHGAFTIVPVVAWPLVIALFFDDYTRLGIVSSISIVALMVLSQIIGRRLDRGGSAALLVSIGVLLLTIDAALKLGLTLEIIAGTVFVIASDMLQRFAVHTIAMPMDYGCYRIAGGESQPANEILLHEFGILIGRTALLVALGTLFSFTENTNLWLGLSFLAAMLIAPFSLLQMKSPTYLAVQQQKNSKG